jgi:hypothetical protein
MCLLRVFVYKDCFLTLNDFLCTKFIVFLGYLSLVSAMLVLSFICERDYVTSNAHLCECYVLLMISSSHLSG